MRNLYDIAGKKKKGKKKLEKKLANNKRKGRGETNRKLI